MPNPFFNPSKLVQGLINTQMPQVGQALNNPVKFLMAEIQKGNPEIMGRLMQVWQNPQESLNKYYANNPTMQQQVNEQLQGKSIEEQRNILIAQLEQNGINIRAIASQFGFSL